MAIFMRLYPSDHVLHKQIQGFIVILDLQTAAYYILDPVATSMWNVLLSAVDEVEPLQDLQIEYSIELSRLEKDFETFRQACIAKGFLQENEPAPKVKIPARVESRHRNLLPLHAWWCLFRTVRALSTKGLSRTYQEFACLPTPEENPKNADELLHRSITAFATAENFFLIRNAPKDCLPRSLALFRFLRSAGLAVEHCIGVQRFPFQAHAWVEYHGHVLLDNPSRQLTFTTLARITA